MASLNTNIGEAKKYVASSDGHEHEVCEKPANRVQLRLKCPGSLQENCEKTERTWHCSKCNDLIQVTKDDTNFYCACGKADGQNFKFKCSSIQHGTKFTTFPPGKLSKYLKPIYQLNILVIGPFDDETPTWLNAFVNYIAYSSLEEAGEGELFSPMPLSFNIIDKNDIVQDVKFETPNVEFNKDKINVNVFPVGNTLVRLIDIPGIRSATDVENMKKEFQKTLAYLHDFEELHGICILLKPDQPKFDVHFQLCFNELLGHFYSNISKNIVFCFTQNRGAPKPTAATRVSLTKLRKENKLDIALDKSTMFSMDQGAFQFLCAQRRGIQVETSYENEFSQSWSASVNETKRLISYFQTIKPHNIQETVSWIAAKKNVNRLPKPIVDVLACIETHILALNKKFGTVYDFYALETKLLGHFEVRCNNAACKTKSTGSICHVNCCLEDIPLGIVGNRGLRDYHAMENGKSLYCIVCDCFWDHHQLIDCNPQFGRNRLENINGMQDIIVELQKEEQLIIESSVKIGRYLSKIAFESYNNIIMDYINVSIKRQVEVHQTLSQNLVEVRKKYFREEKLSQRAMAKPNTKEVDRVEYEKLLNELCALKHYGKFLKVFLAPTLNFKVKNPEICEFYHDLN